MRFGWRAVSRARVVVRGRTAGRQLRTERGSGAVLAIGVLGAIVALMLALVPIAGAFVASQRAANAADAAALAAADVASGAVHGVPCELAARAAELNHASLAACEIEGATALVSVTHSWWMFALSARARAGPPAAE